MADKLAVIDTLSKVRGDDILATSSTAFATIPTEILDSTPVEIPSILIVDPVENHAIINSKQDYGSDTGFLIVNDSGTLKLYTGQTFTGFGSVSTGDVISISKTGLSVTINGITATIPSINPNPDPLELYGTALGWWDDNSFDNTFGKVTVGAHSYVNNGDFGSAILPSKPSGNDGTLSSINMWNKSVGGQHVSIVAPDQAALLAQLPVTPIETWEVIDTTVDQSVPITNDESWLLYTSLYLEVNVQPTSLTIGARKYNYTYGY
jgi:hypothetical protein